MEFRKNIFIFCLPLLVISCSQETNILSLSTPKKHKESFSFLLEQGKAYYDSGELKKALEYAQKAYDLNPESEDASLSLSYIFLGLAGITPIGMAKDLNKQSSDKKNTEAQESSTEESESSNDVLADLSQLIKISSEDFERLGEWNDTDSDLPILEPKCAGEVREIIETLNYVNKGIKTICPFVSEDLLIKGDLRHSCESAPIKRQGTKAHFLWSFLHLVEAIAFHSVLTYKSDKEASKSNLEQRVDKIQSIDSSNPANIIPLINKIKELNTTISIVLPISGSCSDQHPQSQFNALLNDMLSVSGGFNQIPGIPPDVSASITKSMEKITNLSEQSPSDEATDIENDLSAAQSQAFKGDITEKMSAALSEKLNESDPNDYTPEQVENVCRSYNEISGTQSGSVETPKICS